MENEILEDKLNEQNISINVEKQPIEETNSDELSSLESSQNSQPAEPIDIDSANTSNWLALTIRKEHKLVAVKNVFLHTIKVTWKVVVSTITLHVLNLFF